MRSVAIGLCCCWALAGAAPRAAAEEAVDYVRDVKKIFKSRCYACHGALKQEAALRVDSVALLKKGGDSGPAIEPGRPAASRLIERIAAADDATRMPAEGRPLTAEEIAKIAAWVAAGAAAPSDDRAEPDPREHWAFRRPVRPAAPPTRPAWARNPIDAFIAAEHEREGIQPNAEADRSTLLRRVYLDLIGLPPSGDELRAFLADAAPEAYEKVVDRLLASPQYGERWGRHWMDVWRYSDWYGRRTVPDVMNSYPMIWRWRDWIVRSLNEDKGYDRMVLEMLAGDEVAADDDQNVVATGYLVRNFFKWNYNQWMKDNVEHTAKAFLGLTLNCAHCHDHKYDPIAQEDYFRFRAFFEPLEMRHDRVAGSPDPGPFEKYVYGKPYGPIPGGMIRVFDETLDAQTFMYAGGDERNKIEGRPPVEARVPAILGVGQAPAERVDLPSVAAYPGLKPFIQEEERARRQAAISQAEPKIAEAKAEFVRAAPALEAELQAGQSRLAELEASAKSSQALSGKQSLFLDARQGRRALANPVSAVGGVRDGSTIAFQIKLWADAHANFQLGLDISTGATGAYIGFEQGKLLTYRPGTFETVEIGRYDLAAGQSHLQVTGTIDVARDQILLTVKTLPDGAVLASAAPAALHGWNPAGDPRQGIFVDARPGTAVAFDEITFTHPGAPPALRFDFEEPDYPANQDVIAGQGWIVTPFCAAPAVSIVGERGVRDAAEVEARLQVAAAQRKLDVVRLAVAASEAQREAAKQELASLEARIAAGDARYLQAAGANELARRASRAERAVARAKAAADEQAAMQAVAAIEAKPGTDAERAAAMTKADQAHQVATAAVQAANVESEEFTLISPVYPRQSTGRRTALAKAVIDRDNPLTARVAVNHLWARHFGQPLVSTLFDFGRNGKPPSHPELLDWLAVELMEQGWKMKGLHRLIVTSGAYRMASGPSAASPNRDADQENRLLWRFPRRQIEAEAVRDSVLHSAGLLDLSLGGQEIEHAQAAATRRRSLYISHHGEAREPLLETFDAANPGECYRRTQTVAPQQALALVNAELTLQPSRILARRLWQSVSVRAADASQLDAAALDANFVDAAFEHLLTRPPNEQERQAALELLRRQVEVYRAAPPQNAAEPTDASRPAADPALRAKESLIHVLYSHHDFMTIR
ncbi:MAG TPA: PSD1 and planctomycete cytochrome C domain-containing protein [Pirellulales bacterium]|nr:PSD1 and planctomycete cytochrome C domain-containing protein [Pirellulales bacterium]